MYDCSCCQKTLPTKNFDPEWLRELEEARQLYLAVCDDCRLQKENKSLEEKCGKPCVEQKECKHCKNNLPLTDFSAASRRTRSWICWACQHPLCNGPGCDARQPIARVGVYMCDRCQFPPCHVCKKTPRPRTTKYAVRYRATWTCEECETCDTCGGPLHDDIKKRTKNSGLIARCDKCLYPPCECGAPRPRRDKKYSTQALPTWRCSACRPAVGK